MKTTATNRKVHELLTGLRDDTLTPRPEFQRRLEWSNKDRVSFIETVLRGYPFPEIYVAEGEVDLESGKANEMLADGQQRVTTLNQYFTGAEDLKLPATLKPYSDLSETEKEQFLQYDVVVRDLGKLSIEDIREVFRRINATSYSLNAMELRNARYAGQYKEFAETLAQEPFFEKRWIFSPADIRRMLDTLFVLQVVTTALSTYFDGDSEIEEYLQRYNDDFPAAVNTKSKMKTVFALIDKMDLPSDSRAWKKADLFTLLVELHRACFKTKLSLQPSTLALQIQEFYKLVEGVGLETLPANANPKLVEQARNYHFAALQSTNDRRSSRATRGDVIRLILETSARL